MEEKKTKSTGKTIAIILLSILLLGAVGFIGYDKFIEKEDTTTEATKVNSTTKIPDGDVSLDNKVIKKLYDFIDFKGDVAYYSAIKNINDDSSKLYTAYSYIANHEKNTKNCSEVNNLTYKNYYCGDMVNSITAQEYTDANGEFNTTSSKFLEYVKNQTTSSVSDELMDEKMKELYGENYKYTKQDFYMGYGCVLIHYDSKDKEYIKYSRNECGGTSGYLDNTLKSAKKSGNKIVLTVQYIEEAEDSVTTTSTYEFELEEKTNNYIFVKSN